MSLETYWLAVPLIGIGLSGIGWAWLWITRQRHKPDHQTSAPRL